MPRRSLPRSKRQKLSRNGHYRATSEAPDELNSLISDNNRKSRKTSTSIVTCSSAVPQPVLPKPSVIPQCGTGVVEFSDEDEDLTEMVAVPIDYLARLSMEILCRILEYLPLRDIMRMERTCRRSRDAVTMHLRLVMAVDFADGAIFDYMPRPFTDDTLQRFLSRCPELMYIYGFHPHNDSLYRRQKRKANTLSVPGVVSTLQQVQHLRGIETCNIFILQAVLSYLPNVQILGRFRNRGGQFPALDENRITLTRNPQVVHLDLTGVILPSLPPMDVVKHLMLKWVKFTDAHPFKDFYAKNLRSFVMTNCSGPSNALKYVPLITCLAAARSLARLELIRVPFLGGLIQHVVEDSWRTLGFRSLQKIVFGACKLVLEIDLGYLAITCCNNLEELVVQSSLTKDSFFTSLRLSEVHFPKMETLFLGFIDDFPPAGKWTAEMLVNHGLAEVTECPANITDVGIKTAGRVFRNVKSLTIFNCPHLQSPTAWITPGQISWSHLRELTLRRCHSIRLSDFCILVSLLPSIETLNLEQMFREPPKGCSRVGLSAGTGLGVSSALVANTGVDPAHLNPNINPPPPTNQQPANNNQPANQIAENDIPANNDVELLANQDVDAAPAMANEEQPGSSVLTDEHMRNNVASELSVSSESTNNCTASRNITLANKNSEVVTNCSTLDDENDCSQNRPSCSGHNPKFTFATRSVSMSDGTVPDEVVSECLTNSSIDNEVTLESLTSEICPNQVINSELSPIAPNSINTSHGVLRNELSGKCDMYQGMARDVDHAMDCDWCSETEVNESMSRDEGARVVTSQTETCSMEIGTINENIGAEHEASDIHRGEDQALSSDISGNDSISRSIRIVDEYLSKCTAYIDNDSYSRTVDSTDNSFHNTLGDNRRCCNPGNSGMLQPCSSNQNSSFSDDSVPSCSSIQLKPSSPSCSASTILSERQCSLRSHTHSVAIPTNRRLSVSSNSANSENSGEFNHTASCCSTATVDNNPSSSSPNTTGIEPRKGKSLVGSKKGLVKKLAAVPPPPSPTPCSAIPPSAHRIDQSCQAISDEIRESTKKTPPPIPCAAESSNQVVSQATTTTAGLSSCEEDLNDPAVCFDGSSLEVKVVKADSPMSCSVCCKELKCECGGRLVRTGGRKSVMIDKATSTSDPVLEDDSPQVMTISSKSLVNISLREVGITDLVISDCPKLQMLNGCACRVLSNVKVTTTPVLHRISFVQCRKLNHRNLVDRICLLPPDKSRFIFLRPMQDYDEREMLNDLFSSIPYRYHLGLIHDNISPDRIVPNRLRAAAWLEIVTNVNSELLKREGCVAANAMVLPRFADCRHRFTNRSIYSYLWNRSCYSMYGYPGEPEGNRWTMTCDFPWLRTLIVAPPRADLKGPVARDGLYNPSAMGHLQSKTCFALLEQDVAETFHDRRPLFEYGVLVYVSTCDLGSTVPKHDPYS